MDNYHVTDSNLNLKEAASEVDGTQGKWEGGLKFPEKHVNKNISIMSYSTGGTKA